MDEFGFSFTSEVNAARIPLAKVFLAFRTGWNFTSFTKGLSLSYPLFRM